MRNPLVETWRPYCVRDGVPWAEPSDPPELRRFLGLRTDHSVNRTMFGDRLDVPVSPRALSTDCVSPSFAP